jgi:osmotically-inducible protein OsmY
MAMNPDNNLKKLVLEALDFEPTVDCSHIGVTVRDGIVTLSGHVPSNAEKRQAEIAAGRVPGVRAVIDNLFVELPGRVQTEDEVLAERCYNHLANNPAVPLDRIHIGVKAGVVTLHGDVDDTHASRAAEVDLSEVEGVKRVVNELVLRPPVRADLVRDRIRQALMPISPINAESIEVRATGSCVILKGAVNSWHEKGVAESAARSVPGVTAIDDQIVVL